MDCNNIKTRNNKKKNKRSKKKREKQVPKPEIVTTKLVSSSPRPSNLLVQNGKIDVKRSSGSEFEDFQTPSIEYDIKNEGFDENNFGDVSPDYDKEWDELGSFKNSNLENIVELDHCIHKDTENCINGPIDKGGHQYIGNGDVGMALKTCEKIFEDKCQIIKEDIEMRDCDAMDEERIVQGDDVLEEYDDNVNNECYLMCENQRFEDPEDDNYEYPAEETTTVPKEEDPIIMEIRSSLFLQYLIDDDTEEFNLDENETEKNDTSSDDYFSLLCTDENLEEETLVVEKIVLHTSYTTHVQKSITLKPRASENLFGQSDMLISTITSLSEDNIPHRVSTDKKSDKTFSTKTLKIYRNFINKFKKGKSAEKYEHPKVTSSGKEENKKKDKSLQKEEFKKEKIVTKSELVEEKCSEKSFSVKEKSPEKELFEKDKNLEKDECQKESFEHNLSVRSVDFVKDSEIESNQSLKSINEFDNISQIFSEPVDREITEPTPQLNIKNEVQPQTEREPIDKKKEIKIHKTKHEKQKSLMNILKRKHKIKKQPEPEVVVEITSTKVEDIVQPKAEIGREVLDEFNDTIKSLMFIESEKRCDDTVVVTNNKSLHMNIVMDRTLETSCSVEDDGDDHLFPDAVTATKILGSQQSSVPYIDDDDVHKGDCISFYNGESKRIRISPEYFVPIASMESLYFPGDSVKNEKYQKSLISQSPCRRKRVLGTILGCMSRGR